MAAYLRSFPTPETRLFKILNDEEFKHSFLTNLKIYNPLIVALYRSGILPLCGWSRTVMLLMTTGRKSGKPCDTPIGFFLNWRRYSPVLSQGERSRLVYEFDRQPR
jgi:hypothetical protein